MGRFLGGIFSNDSLFGQLMTRCWILVGANLMFVFFSVPVVTAGPAFVALFHVMLKVLRGDRDLNPFKEFWKGFRSNLKQGTVCWLAFLAIAALAYLDFRFLRNIGAGEGAAFANLMKYSVLAVLIAAAIVMIFLFPVMAAFADTIPHLIRNAVFFAVKNPLRLILMAVIWGVPLAVTYIDTQTQPLYAFCWFFFGFSAVAMACSSLLIRDFSKYLPPTEEERLIAESETSGMQPGTQAPSAKQTLQDMKKMKM